MDEKFLYKVLAMIEKHMDMKCFPLMSLAVKLVIATCTFTERSKHLPVNAKPVCKDDQIKTSRRIIGKKSDNVHRLPTVLASAVSYFNKCFKEQFGVTPGQFADGNIRADVK